MVGIAGPGDPFATPDADPGDAPPGPRAHPEMLLCVASNGLNVSPYADELGGLR